MISYLSIGLIASGSGLLVFAVAFATRLLSYRPSRRDGERVQRFALLTYEPMMRLFSEDDFQFLESQPGYRAEVGAKLRRARRRILRMYLRELAQDFHSLHAEARALVAESEEQHAVLVGVLIRQQLTFWRATAAVEFRIMGSRVGLTNVDLRGLVRAVETMRADLERLAEPAAA